MSVRSRCAPSLQAAVIDLAGAKVHSPLRENLEFQTGLESAPTNGKGVLKLACDRNPSFFGALSHQPGLLGRVLSGTLTKDLFLRLDERFYIFGTWIRRKHARPFGALAG